MLEGLKEGVGQNGLEKFTITNSISAASVIHEPLPMNFIQACWGT